MHLSTFYQSAGDVCDDRIRAIRRRSNIVSLLRLLLFAGIVFTLYQLAGHFSTALLLLPVILLALFITTVNYYFRLKDERALWEKLSFVNANERRVLSGEANAFSDGLVFLDPDNYLDDLDIFGKASLFHVLNRTTTSHGTTVLAELLRQSLLSTDGILQKQEAVKGLSGQAELRRLLTAKGLLTGEKEGNLYSLNDWLKMPPRIYDRIGLRILIALLTLFNIWAIYFCLADDILLVNSRRPGVPFVDGLFFKIHFPSTQAGQPETGYPPAVCRYPFGLRKGRCVGLGSVARAKKPCRKSLSGYPSPVPPGHFL